MDAGTQQGFVSGSSPLFQPGYGVVRLESNAAIDSTFGTNGGAFVGFIRFRAANGYASAIQSNEDIVVAGDTAVSTASNAPANCALATVVDVPWKVVGKQTGDDAIIDTYTLSTTLLAGLAHDRRSSVSVKVAERK